MTIYEQILDVLKDRKNEVVTVSELKSAIKQRFGTNPSSVIPSDYCYNRYNNGISFTKHLFEYINRSTYIYLGEHAKYTGLIFQRPRGSEQDIVIGEWVRGEKILHNLAQHESKRVLQEVMSQEQIINLYNEYNQILRYEMTLLDCKPTELRHLIGRIGEFLCAIKTKGNLARQPNQHGFDVISNGRRISVKTTAQTIGFVTVNQRTFDDFDDFFVVQYVNDDFNVIFYGEKEEVRRISRVYGDKFEIDIAKLKKQHVMQNMIDDL